MSFDDIVFTFPFTIPTLITAVLAYVCVVPLLTKKLSQHLQFVLWGVVAIALAVIFPWGYGLRFLLAIAIMVASRMRLNQTGILKEIIMLVITLVCAMLFVGLR